MRTRDYTERLERAVERAHRLFMSTMARLIEAMDAQTPDADLEPSLAGFAGQAGSGDDHEADYGGVNAGVSDDEPLQAWTEGMPRRGHFNGGFASDDDEHSLGSLQGTATANEPWMPREGGVWTRGRPQPADHNSSPTSPLQSRRRPQMTAPTRGSVALDP